MEIFFLSSQDLPRVKTLSSGFLSHGVPCSLSPSSRQLHLLRDCPQERAKPIPVRLGEPFKNLTLA